MYTLYYVPQACSLATQAVLRELGQDVRLVNKNDHHDFKSLNPVGTVPVLDDGQQILREGAAVMLHILKQHPSALFPKDEAGQTQATQNIMFANATMHPAYSRLFFIAQSLTNEAAKKQAFQAAQEWINVLWQVVENRLVEQSFLGGEHYSAADIMLAVYSRWGEHFPVVIEIGRRTRAMLDTILSLPSLNASLEAEAAQAA
ncbi:MAG: glutathione S-transferase [Oceanicoccus sp.]|jgi:glutathione S-transferase